MCVRRAQMTRMNRAAWNEISADWEKRPSNVAIPPSFFRRGGTTLYPFEIRMLGPVRGKSLLHLLCGAGEDSVSWAKLGARVTGIDIAENRLKFAEKRAAGAGVKVRFVRADTMRLPLKERSFDRAFAAAGILAWIPDIDRWFRGIARVLKPGGKFLLWDGHPIMNILEHAGPRKLRVIGSYFDNRPERMPGWWFRIGIRHPRVKVECQWTVADVVNGALGAGLEIVRMEELPANPGKKGVQGHVTPRWRDSLPDDLVLLCRKPASRS